MYIIYTEHFVNYYVCHKLTNPPFIHSCKPSGNSEGIVYILDPCIYIKSCIESCIFACLNLYHCNLQNKNVYWYNRNTLVAIQ